MDEANWSSLKVTELKVALKERGLAVNGRKADLIKRLEEYDAENNNANATQPQPSENEEEVAVAQPQPPPVDDADIDDLQPSSPKRQRYEDEGVMENNDNNNNVVALYAPPLEENVDQQQNIRTSSLAEPTMKLSGHKGSVYCLAYDQQGEFLVSGSFDSTCLLWKGEFNEYV